MEILFYQKPGCINNTKQIQLLKEKGHTLKVFSIFEIKWTKQELRQFFGNMPTHQWFNKSAPRIKNGEIDPFAFTEDSALEAMIVDNYLIKRPLIEAKGIYAAGFENELVENLLNTSGVSTINPKDLINCPNLGNKCD